MNLRIRLPTPPQRRLPASLTQSIGTGVLGQVVLVASGIIVARALGPHDRGVLALLTLLPGLAGLFVTLGVPLAATYAIAADGVNPTALLRRLRGPIALQLLAAGAIHGTLIVVLLTPRSPNGFFVVALVSLVLSVAALAQAYGLAMLQGEKRFSAFNALRVGPACLYVVLVVALVAVHRVGLVSIAVVWIAANATVAAATVAFALRKSRQPRGLPERVPSIRSLISFGVRAMFGAASPISSYRLDQMVVGAILTPAALGLYVVALAFTNLTRFVGQSIGMVAYPSVAANASSDGRRRATRVYFGIGAAICTAVTVVLIIAVPWLLPAFFGNRFAAAIGPARLLLLAGLFASLRRILADTTRGGGRPMWGTLAELSTLVALPLAVIAMRLGAGLSGVAAALVAGDGLGLSLMLPALVSLDGFGLPPVRPAIRGGAWLVASLPLLFSGWAVTRVPWLLAGQPLLAIPLLSGIVSLAPLVARVRGRRFDVFEPIVPACIMLFFLFAVRPFYVLLEKQTTFHGVDFSRTLVSAMVAGLIGTSTLVLGYEWVSRRPARERGHRRDFSVNLVALVPVAAAVWCLGLGLYSLNLMRAGSIRSGINALSAGRSVSVAGLSASSEYLTAAPILLSCLAIVLVATKSLSVPLTRGVAIASALVPAAMFLTLGGQRRFGIPCVLIPVICWYLVRGARPRRRVLASVGLGAFLFLAIVPAWRSAGARAADAGGGSILKAAFASPASTLGQFLSGNDTAMIAPLAIQMGVQRSAGDFYYGRASLGDLVIQPIPSRLIAKPAQARNLILIKAFGLPCEPARASCPDMSAVGTFYQDFWWPGIMLGMWSLGAGAATLWRRWINDPTDPSRIALAGTASVFVAIIIRAGFEPAFGWSLYFALPVLVLLRAFTARSSSFVAMPQRPIIS